MLTPCTDSRRFGSAVGKSAVALPYWYHLAADLAGTLQSPLPMVHVVNVRAG